MPIAITPAFSTAGTVLTGVVVAWLLLNSFTGPRTYRRLLAAGGRINLVRFYRLNLIVQWLGVVFVLAIFMTSPGLAAADLGLAWPSGDLALLAVAGAAYSVPEPTENDASPSRCRSRPGSRRS